MRSEEFRINFLLKRDGLYETVKWVHRGKKIYTEHLPKSYSYRPLFEQSIKEFRSFLWKHWVLWIVIIVHGRISRESTG